MRNLAFQLDTSRNHENTDSKPKNRKARSVDWPAGVFIPEATLLLDLARALLPVAFPSKSFFRAPLFTWLQVKRMPLDFLHNVLLLDFALETPQSAFESFAFLYMDFSQLKCSPPSS